MSEATTAPATPGPNMSKRIRAILGGSAGNLVEWYDWFAYSSFALYFAPAFFPKGDQTAQLLQSAAIFAVGFLARPFGAWMMGKYADRAGRRAALSASIFLMCFGSLIIALAPTYAQIGAAAPLILLLARLIQGVSVGGEYGSSATYLSEVAGKKARGFFSSLQIVTLVAGQLMALFVLLLLQAILSEEALKEWGWRIPFFIGAALAVVVFVIRRGMHETDSFKNAQDAPRATARMLFKEYPVETLMTVGLTITSSLSFYTFTTYMQKFLVNTSGFTKPEATQIMTGALLYFICLVPFLGALSDKVGRRPMMMGSFALTALSTYPIMTAIAATNSTATAFFLICLSLTLFAGYSSISAITKAELFPAHIRALGVALPYSLANAVFGGTAEYVALWFKTHNESGFYLYVTSAAILGFLIAARMRDTKHASRILED
jgi:MFS transporter, MHS family, alpha-ketoglutarate permease